MCVCVCVCVLPVTKKKIIVPIYLLANKQLMNKRVLFLTTGCFYHMLWRLTIQNTARPASYGAYLYCNFVCSYKPHVIMLMMSVDGAVAKSLVNVQLLSVQNRKELCNIGKYLKHALYIRSQHM